MISGVIVLIERKRGKVRGRKTEREREALPRDLSSKWGMKFEFWT